MYTVYLLRSFGRLKGVVFKTSMVNFLRNLKSNFEALRPVQLKKEITLHPKKVSQTPCVELVGGNLPLTAQKYLGHLKLSRSISRISLI